MKNKLVAIGISIFIFFCFIYYLLTDLLKDAFFNFKKFYQRQLKEFNDSFQNYYAEIPYF
jgi:hypothetical protein